VGQPAQVYVAKWTNSVWTSLGSSLNVDPAGSAQRTSLAVAGGSPAAAWGEVTYGSLRQVYVKQWNGSGWTLLTNGVGPGPGPTLACDLNADGVVNNLDVQIAISQALGNTPCTGANLPQSGQCNIVGVQRVIIASMGGSCKVGQ
jgi:hypothetical protein